MTTIQIKITDDKLKELMKFGRNNGLDSVDEAVNMILDMVNLVAEIEEDEPMPMASTNDNFGSIF